MYNTCNTQPFLDFGKKKKGQHTNTNLNGDICFNGDLKERFPAEHKQI